MRRTRKFFVSGLALLTLLLLLAAVSWARRSNSDLLYQVELKPSSPQVKAIVGDGLKVSIAPGEEGYPGVNLKPPSGVWDFSSFGHVEAKIENTGANPIYLNLRVDNAGNWQDNPWNSEAMTIAPGETATIRTSFGYSYGHNKGFNLDPAHVVNVLFFTGKTAKPLSFRVISLVAGGTPNDVPPANLQPKSVKPEGGVLFSATAGQPKIVNGPFKIVASADALWDLRDYNEIEVTVDNVGKVAQMPKVQIESNGGSSDEISPKKPIAPGTKSIVEVPFFHHVDLNAQEQKGLITSDTVKFVTVSGNDLEVLSVKAVLKKAELPAWLGKTPPVSGGWTKTLDDNFDGTAINPKVWKATGANYYDKLSHWSKDNVIVKDGVVRLRYEKKAGNQNDDPKGLETPYASGYLDTYGLWTQKYGYFECRMKLPKAPGLWPAFWMMPERGVAAGPDAGKRNDTSNGGMEFDIMEHLTRWGGQRYNIAMHWDGYGKDHKSVGNERIYVEPDKDGFITCGLLWLPGSVDYFCNGVDVLSWKSPRISNVPSMLMFTLPMGGWDNNQLDDKKLPDDFIIDYVRVWQRKDLAS